MTARGSAPAVPRAPARPTAAPNVSTSGVSTPSMSTPGVWFWIALAGLTAGTFDLLFAMGWWALRDVAPIRIAHSIAAGIIGRDAAYAGGTATALFGIAVHYAQMIAIAAGYILAANRHTTLLRHPLRHGALYGALCYFVVHVVLVPMFSAAPPRASHPDWTLACLLVFMGLVGIPCALFARVACAEATRSA